MVDKIADEQLVREELVVNDYPLELDALVHYLLVVKLEHF